MLKEILVGMFKGIKVYGSEWGYECSICHDEFRIDDIGIIGDTYYEFGIYEDGEQRMITFPAKYANTSMSARLDNLKKIASLKSHQ